MSETASPSPLYLRTYLLLRQRILSGDWQHGELFPTEQELCRTMEVSRVTVRRALEMLTEDQLLRRFQGRGTIVSPSVTPKPVLASISGQIANATDLGRATKVTLLHYGKAKPPPSVASAFRCQKGETLHRNVRLRSYQKVPVSLITSWLPLSVGARISKEALLSSQPILSLLQNMLKISAADQIISAKIAGAEVARPLRVPVGAPLLEVTRTVEVSNSTIGMLSVALYNPEFYQYRLRLEDPLSDPWTREPHA